MAREQRVHCERLEPHPDEGDGCRLNGRPFTGVAYNEQADGTVGAEWTLRDGLLWGPQRAWGAGGAPCYAWYAIRGLAHGVYRVWWATGRLAKLALCEYGIEVRSRSWNEDGSIFEDLNLSPKSLLASELRQREAEFGHLVAAEKIPPEFTQVAEGEWGDSPPPE